MTIIRLGEIQAREGKAGELLEYLHKFFVPSIEAAEGCTGYQILQRHDDPTRITILEVWDSLEAHKSSAMSIPPEVVQNLREIIAGAPSGGYYEVVKSK